MKSPPNVNLGGVMFTLDWQQLTYVLGLFTANKQHTKKKDTI